ncbi:MAG TPA: efflux RND transporter periplasmic adaptor subunit [Xanthobacteraceae bacterium]|nr:efflux RND transporter periplasmic adaptor subunit [Xanthobacteraceae bacterium]
METTRSGAWRKNRFAAIAAFAGVFVVAGSVYWYWSQGPDPAHAARVTRPAIPVTVATASRQDVPIYLTGLGTAQAFYTISIHAQVDGKLQDVFFKEGQPVKKGDILGKIDPRLYQAALDATRARKAQDDAQLVAAVKDMARFQTLVLRNAETQQNVDLQQAKVDQTKAAIAADVAAIETAQTNLDYTDIVAPVDGRMGVRMVDPGNIVHASDQAAIGILTQTEPTNVLFTLPAQTLDSVREAMKRGEVEVEAYDRNNTKLLSKGKLATIDNLIDQTTATYRLKAVFANDDEKLWPGEFVNARLLLEVRKDVVVVPPLAVQRGPHGLFSWVVRPDNTVEPRPIQTSNTTGDRTIITSGIQDGDRVVTDGQYKLQTNAPVTAAPPPAKGTASQGDAT